jgi:hypothetical protein
MILPATLSDIGSMISLAMNVIRQKGTSNGAPEKGWRYSFREEVPDP